MLHPPYPGNVDVPMELIVPEDVITQIGTYGDIVAFPGNGGANQAATSRSGVPFMLHPQQKFKLTRPK